MRSQALRDVWRALTDPPHQKPVYAAAYTITIVTGIATLVAPPMSIKAEIGPALMAWIGVTFVIGGAVAAPAMMSGWWWLERAAIGGIATGVAMYAAVVTLLHFEAQGSRLTQLGMIALATLLFLLRFLTIWGRSYEPKGA